MKSVEQKLRAIAHYYSLNRRAGHTTVMMEGVLHHTDALVLVNDHQSGMHITRGGHNGKPITLQDLGGPNSRGHHRPLVVDNFAMHQLCAAAAEELRITKEEARTARAWGSRLEAHINALEGELRGKQRMIEEEQEQIKRMGANIAHLKLRVREWQEWARDWGAVI